MYTHAHAHTHTHTHAHTHIHTQPHTEGMYTHHGESIKETHTIHSEKERETRYDCTRTFFTHFVCTRRREKHTLQGGEDP